MSHLRHWLSPSSAMLSLEDVDTRLAEESQQATGGVLPHQPLDRLGVQPAILSDPRDLLGGIRGADVRVEPGAAASQRVGRHGLRVHAVERRRGGASLLDRRDRSGFSGPRLEAEVDSGS